MSRHLSACGFDGWRCDGGLVCAFIANARRHFQQDAQGSTDIQADAQGTSSGCVTARISQRPWRRVHVLGLPHEEKAAMKIRTCDVGTGVVRVDITWDGILFRGATLRGEGGILGGNSATNWTNLPPRFLSLQAKRSMLTIYTRLTADRTESFDAPAAECQLMAVYAPGYSP